MRYIWQVFILLCVAKNKILGREIFKLKGARTGFSPVHLDFFQISQKRNVLKIVKNLHDVKSHEDVTLEVGQVRALIRPLPFGPRDACFNQEDLRVIDGPLTAVLGQHLAGSQDPRG